MSTVTIEPSGSGEPGDEAVTDLAAAPVTEHGIGMCRI